VTSFILVTNNKACPQSEQKRLNGLEIAKSCQTSSNS